MSSSNEIWVLLEADDRKISSRSAALLAEGRRLSHEAGGELHAIFLGPALEAIGTDARLGGVTRLYLNDDEAFLQYDPALYEDALNNLIADHKPALLLALSSSIGSDLLPRLAFKWESALVVNCADIEVRESGGFQFIKMVQKGRLFASVNSPTPGMKMATFLPERLATDSPLPDSSGEVKVALFKTQADRKRAAITVTGFIKADHRTIDIAEAEVIVAVGRGVVSIESFAAVKEFADQVGGAIGGTRPMVDAGMIPYERQIGQTGKRVSPKLIFLFGVSGATEFIQGVSNPGTSVAINIDRQAPVFKSVDLGVVGNITELTPKLVSRVTGRQKRS